jgi:hypothetical protein
MDLTSLATPPTNYIGSALFASYILAALYFTARVVFPLRALSTASPRPARLQPFPALALLAFAALSYNMLAVLGSFYARWAAAHTSMLGRAPTLGPASLLRWARESTLFHAFVADLRAAPAGWAWAQAALLWTLGASTWVAVEGRRRSVPRLPALFAVAQILEVSFALNLFFVAALLAGPPAAEKPRKGAPADAEAKLEKRGPRTVLAATAVYLAALLALGAQPANVPRPTSGALIFVLRATLLVPFVVTARAPAPIPHRAFRAAYALLGGAGAVVTAYAVARALAAGGAGELAAAWSANAPVRALAVDLGVGLLGTAAWAMRDRAVQP